MESEFTAQSLVEGARCLKKSASLCEEGPLFGRRIRAGLCVFTAPMLGQEAALDVSRVRIGCPDEAVNNFNAACGLRPLC